LSAIDDPELFVVDEGEATFIAGGEEITVRGGNVHVSPRFVTEWL
jgi:mannose-6-phosphate isomerase-like protein (cupin superfamily)